MRQTIEEFSPTHDFFDYRGSGLQFPRDSLTKLQVLACAPLHFHFAAQMMLQGTLIELFLPPRHD
jgi:hypothetical protein